MLLAAAGFLFFAWLVPEAQAQVYKCVDKSGKITYLQSPCPKGDSAKVISSTPAPANEARAKPAGKSAAETKLERQKQDKERAETEKKANDQAAELKRKQDECRRAREELANYSIGGRIARLDDKGERYILGEEQVVLEKAKAQASVDQLCK